MADRDGPRSQSLTGPNLDAFRRHRGDTPTVNRSAVVSALSGLLPSDDPAVVFARLAETCAQCFADGCGIEISDGEGLPLRVTYPPEVPASGPGQVLHTPFRVPSQFGYPSYAGVLTHWWNSRIPTETDAVVADLMAKHVIALVDRERLMAVVARSDGRAAELALEAICGRTINTAIGIVMHQRHLSPDDAEDLLRQTGAATGETLYDLAGCVVRSGGLGDLQPEPRARTGSGSRARLRSVGQVRPPDSSELRARDRGASDAGPQPLAIAPAPC